jgi:hypothetical protein
MAKRSGQITPGAKCTGRVPVKGPDRRMLRDDNDNVITRPCKNPPVEGTTVCKSHGANAPHVKARAAVVAEVIKWGLGDTTVDPGEILLRLVSQSANRAQLYARLLQEQYETAAAGGTSAHGLPADVSALIGHKYSTTMDGDRVPVEEAIRGLVQLEAQERDRCASFAAKAVAAGLAERQVRLAERQGELIVQVLRAVFDELDLTDGQREVAPDVIRRHLTLLA